MKIFAGWIIIFLLLSLCLSGCAGKPAATSGAGGKAATPVSFKVAVLRGPTALGAIKLMEDNPSFGDGVTVSYAVLDSPDQATAKLLSGDVNMAALPTNLAATLYNKGVPLQLASVSSWGVLYVVGRGTTPDLVLRYLLKGDGIDPDQDVTLDYTMDQVEVAQSLIAGRIKLAVLPEPWVTQALMGSSSVRVALDLQQEWGRVRGSNALAMTCLAVKKDLPALTASCKISAWRSLNASSSASLAFPAAAKPPCST